ncbi:helix-turn-helix transcriptional regulator [Erythrobacter sp.]|uniref:helix-turn-helix domain-containing protein n=1 Tax=Erythrobacter sp. TaxID=1042 RepID=UPI001B2C6539|nr:helix-turn-helix transcriptional regulator [Erythrobacter sp.]MBO6526416.1 helix-turn-helix transcriptional regulator [Erythrobacter sp.]MBO6530313.1 helix-turn-helix transcriptional regulator [Erythrobacter sp.]
MPKRQVPFSIDDLTEKQLEALDFVGEGYMSKEAARILGISHKSFDRRIEIAKKKLGAATRAEAARMLKMARGSVEFDHKGPTPILPGDRLAAQNAGREKEDPFIFADPTNFVEPAPWQSFLESVSEMRPAQFGVISRLVLMLVAAVLIMAVLLLGLGIVEGLETLR